MCVKYLLLQSIKFKLEYISHLGDHRENEKTWCQDKTLMMAAISIVCMVSCSVQMCIVA